MALESSGPSLITNGSFGIQPIRGDQMDLRNDELMIWKDKARMMINGPTATGELIITNKRIAFIAKSDPTYFSKAKKTNLWDIAIDRVQDVDEHMFQGLDHPVIRIHYTESDNYFTFPDSEPKASLAAIRLFINSARRIERELDLMRGVGRSLKDDTLHLHGKMPELIKDIPKPADQVCFQCGNNLHEPSAEDPDDTSTCTVCGDLTTV